MRKRVLPLSLAIALLAGPTAHAQYGGGGMGGGGGGGHRHGGGQRSQGGGDSSGPPSRSTAAANPAETPMSKITIVGVVQAIGPEPDRLTIAYEPVQALGWPAGAQPFVVSRTALMQGVTVGEKVRFKLDSQQISELKPF